MVVEIKHKLWVGGFYHFSLICPLHGARLLDYGDKTEHQDGKHHYHDPEHPEGVEIEDDKFKGVPATCLEFYIKAGVLLAELAVQAARQQSKKVSDMYMEAAQRCAKMERLMKETPKEEEQDGKAD